MPPPISDDERSDTSESLEAPKQRGRKPASKPESEVEPEDDVDVDDIPNANPKTQNGDEEAEEEEEEDDDDDDDDELEEDEFVVEKILQHVVEDGKLMFQVKWEGWDNPEDITYEPEENLVGSAEGILNAYYKSVGGRDKVMQEIQEAQERIKEQKKRKRGRASTGADTKRARKTNGHPRDTTPPTGFSEKNGVFSPPSGSWEDYIETVDASQDESSGKLIVYLTWKNGQKTCHDTRTVYKRCPQQMLRFYENHIKIITHETAENDDLQNNPQEKKVEV